MDLRGAIPFNSARECVSFAWMLDPLAETLEVLRLEGSRWSIVSTYVGTDVARAEPFDSLGLELTLLWDESAAASPPAAKSP